MAARRSGVIMALAAVALAGGTLAAGMQARDGGSANGAERAAAPTLVGQRAGGGAFSLRDLAGAPAVLVFYRGAYCPLCVRRLESLAAHAPAYERAGARVVAVTADGPDAARETARAIGDAVTIVSTDPATLRAWGVWPEGAPAPLPAEFLLADDGTVLFRHLGRTAAEDAGDVVLLGALRDWRAGRVRSERQ